MTQSGDEEEFSEDLVDALRSLADDDEQAVDGLMLDGLRRRMGLVEQRPRIDRFEVLEELGAGGMGVVVAAHDPRLDRRVALKLLRRAGPAGAEQGLNEARALARLSHPHVVTVFEAGIHDGQVFMAMELVQGQTLREWLKEQRSWREVCEVLVAAGRGLAAAHAAGIVHRDFKPDNVLLGDRVRVADFGLAQSASTWSGEEPTRSEASTGRRPGTLSYMAPEQLRGEPLDARTDQFALCLTLYRALSGTSPFEGESLRERLESIERGPRTGPLDGVPHWLRALVLRGLESDPERRHPDLDTLLDAIERHLRPRHRAGWVVAGLMGLLAAGTVVAAAVVEREEPCKDAEAELDAVWNATRSEAVAEAFGAIDQEYARHAQGFVQASLDHYASQWTEARLAACRAELRGEAPTERLQCLRNRRVEMEVLVEQLEEADEGLARVASNAVSSLTPVKQCEQLGYTIDLTSVTAEDRERLLALQDDLSRAWVLEQLGAYDRGVQQVDAVMPELRRLGHAAVLGMALQQRGRLKLYTGDYETSHADLREAVELGLVGRSDFVVAKAAESLVNQLTQRREFVRAREAAELALAMHQRLTGETIWPSLSNMLGTSYVHEGKDAQAVEILAEGIAACSADESEHWADLISMHGNRSMALIRLGRLEEAEADVTKSMALSQKLIGTEHPQYALLMISRAALLNSQGDVEGALATQRAALETWRRAVPKPTVREASMLYNVGLYLLDLERADEAGRAIEQAQTLWNDLLPEGHPRRAAGHTGMGQVRLAQGDARGALEQHEQALQLLSPAVEKRQPSVGWPMLCAAKAAIEADELARAETLIDQGLEIYATTPNPVMEGSFRFERARLLWRTEEPAAARQQAQQVIELVRDRDPKTLRRVEAWLAERGE